jgi:Ca2+-transporting ATPase
VSPIEVASHRHAWHALSADEVLAMVGAGPEGLTSSEAAARLGKFGPNEFVVVDPLPAWRILLAQVRSVVVLLLFVAMVVALLFGESVEALAIAAVLALNTLLGFFTELKARRAMEALLELDVPHAHVVRDGRPQEIDARELVPGDVVSFAEGDSIPADVRLLETAELHVVEASLTGESHPSHKDAAVVLDDDDPLPDRRNLAYKATAVAIGSASAVVVATGSQTEVGKIGRLIGEIPDEKTPLEHRLDALGRRLVWLTLLVAVVVASAGLVQGGDLFIMVETGIALAIAAVPEGLPAVATIALAVGLRRMARRSALIRRLPAVEALGSTTVVCTDKTGTLTAGQMTVTRFWSGDRELRVSGTGYEPAGEFRDDSGSVSPEADAGLALALRVGLLAGRGDVVRQDGHWRAHGDPTEAALVVAARKAGLERGDLLASWPKEGEVPFSSSRRLMATFHRTEAGLRACVKGAPESLIELSARKLVDGDEVALEPLDRDDLSRQNERLAAEGLRVLALATKLVEAPEERELDGLTFVGLVGMMDPPAEGVLETIETFRTAGIRTVMLTGDQRLTAQAVARELAILEADEQTLDGKELGRLDAAQLAERVRRIDVFSRIGPEDKLRIVTAYQEGGDVVAMLGDGVNDAAALKKADVGVAMGLRGTDIAKEAADVVLQDDRFRTLGAAVEEGRIIFDNIRKFVFYLFSCNAAEVLTLFVAGVIGLPLPLLPLQILWLNLVTDTFPALALALEPAEPGVMQRPPRDPGGALMSGRFIRAIGFYGGLITISTLCAFLLALDRHPGGYEMAVTYAFMTLSLAQIFHLGNARSLGPVLAPSAAMRNRWALAAVVLAVGLQFTAVFVAPVAEVLRVVPLAASDLLVIGSLALVPAVVGQAIRWRRTRRGPEDLVRGSTSA